MTGRHSRTTSPSRSTTSRRTPCVAGWCGPMLTVMISVPRSSVRSSLTRSVARPACSSAIVAFVEGVGDGLAADREVAALRPADVVVGQQDPGQLRVAAELDPEEVEGFALLEVGGREELDAGVDRRQRALAGVVQHRFHPDPLDPVAVQ